MCLGKEIPIGYCAATVVADTGQERERMGRGNWKMVMSTSVSISGGPVDRLSDRARRCVGPHSAAWPHNSLGAEGAHALSVVSEKVVRLTSRFVIGEVGYVKARGERPESDIR